MGDKYLYCKTSVKYPFNTGDIIYHAQSKTAEIRTEGGYCDLKLSRVFWIDGKSISILKTGIPSERGRRKLWIDVLRM